MTLQERMLNMKPYFRGVEMYNDALIVKVVMPSKWKVFGTEDEKIKVAPSDSVEGEYFFYANINESSYDEMFDVVEYVIKTNLEMGLKMELLKDKINELKEIFSNTEYDKLKSIKIVFDEEKAKPKPQRKSRTKKAKETSPEVQEIKDAEVVDNG